MIFKLKKWFLKINKAKRKKQLQDNKVKLDRLTKEFEQEKSILEQMLKDGDITPAFYHDRLRF